MRTFWKTVTLVLLGTMCAASPAIACVDIQPFKIEGIRRSEAIFVGEAIKYERLRGDARKYPDFGFLKVRVRQVIRGHLPDEMYLFWSSNFGVRKYLYLPRRAIFATTRNPYADIPSKMQKEAVDRFGRSNLFYLDGATCSSGYILDASESNIEAIRRVVRGEQVDPRDYRVSINAMARRAAEREFREEREWRETKRAAIVGLAGAVLFCALIAFLWRRRTR